MAIAGLVILGVTGGMGALRAALEKEERITDVVETDDPQRLAAVLEVSADAVERVITDMLGWDCVLSVDLAYVNYEDDVEEKGEIPCPPHQPRKKHL